MNENLDRAQVLGELSVEAAGVGTFDWDLRTGVLTCDDRLVEQYGYTQETFPGTVEALGGRIHPEDREHAVEVLNASVRTRRYADEYRIVRPDGGTRWISAQGRVFAAPDGSPERLLGATLDVTASRAGELAVISVLEAMNASFLSVDDGWRLTFVNSHAEGLLGLPRVELLGRDLWAVLPEHARVGDFGQHLRQAAETGETHAFDASLAPGPGADWYEVRVLRTVGGLSVYFIDITARRQAQETAESAVRRAGLVAQVTSELAEHLEAEVAVARLARLVVPGLADWCLVSLVDDTASAGSRNSLRDVGWWHVDEDLRDVVGEYAAARLSLLDRHEFVLRAMESSEPVVVPRAAASTLRQVLRPGRAADYIGRLAPEYTAIFPLRARGRTVGLLSLYNGPERGALSPEDFQTAVEMAGRAGLALDNSRLYRQQLHLAEGLQRSLLTPPPSPDRVQVAVRYTPAAEAAQVGGDWYDAFVQPGGSTILVIGDVVGHDAQAAAAMGQLRTLVRGMGAVEDDGPAEILRKVDRLLRTLAVDTTATGIVARLEDAPGSAGGVQLRWSNAGHLPPVALLPHGGVRMLREGPADLLLGVLPETTRTEAVVPLEEVVVVLMYTDGLVERRRLSLEEGLEALRATLAELAGLPLEELCDEILRRMLPERPEDDVALVAVRLDAA